MTTPTDSISECSSFPISIVQDEEHVAQRRFLFFFINPASGSTSGLALIESGVNHISIATPEPCEIYITDISNGPSGNKRSFQLLANAIETSKRFQEEWQRSPKSSASSFTDLPQFIVMCVGGDGTIVWCITEMLKHNVDMKQVGLGVIPCGTGNDFAIAFGWKNFSLQSHVNKSLKSIRSFLETVLNSKVVRHDLWDVTVEKCDSGSFSKIDPKSRQDREIKNENVEGGSENTLVFTMSNYFSMGVESRIGRGFDKNRMRSRFLNKLCYALEGIRICFKKNKTINTIVRELVEKGEEGEKVIVTTNKGSADPHLGKAVTLAALNIPSFSSGNDVWKSSRYRGIHYADKQATKECDLLKLNQETGDNMLEFLTFSRTADLGLEFIFKGQGKRVHQGAGPWEIKFAQMEPSTRIYFQIDGEFRRMTVPKSIKISRKCDLSVLVPR